MPTTPPASTPSMLITGATGDVGSALVDLLHGQGAPIRALVRRPEQATELTARGINAALGDFSDPNALRRAMTGCTQLLLLVPTTADQLQLDKTAVDAAKAAGIQHVVKDLHRRRQS